MTQSEPKVPEQIGRYKITEKIGEGSMSVVYKAFDADIDRSIAIKLMRPEVLWEPDYRERFLSEAKAAGNLIHPNIVTIFDVGECEAGPYIAMDFLDGPTLEELMEPEARPPLRQVLNIGIQLAEALDHAHQHGIIHRDVKPSNIIQLRERNLIRITDFGIAHIENAEKMYYTASGTVLGTPQYMSPEQIEGATVDGRSDLFSVGVILYQLVTGQRPFAANTLASLYAKIVREDPVAVEKLAPGLPAGLIHTIKKLLNKEPARRFRSARELADALRSLVEDLDAREQRDAEARLVPLRVKYTLVLATLVSVAIVIATYLVHRQEVNAMTNLALDFGSSLTRFVASQNAEPMVIEDWVAIEFFVKDTTELQQISHLRITDRNGVIRGSLIPEERGQAFTDVAAHKRLIEKGDDLIVREVETDASSYLDFEAPILYQSKEMGRVYLGLSKESLERAANLTLYTMMGLSLAVVLTVIVAAYLLWSRISAPITILHGALRRAAEGNLSYRISETRNDELGQMFKEFNSMADHLERIKDERSASSPPAVPVPARPMPKDAGERAARALSPEDPPTLIVPPATDEAAEPEPAPEPPSK